MHNAVKAADFRVRADKDDYVLFLGRMSPDESAHLAIDAARASGRASCRPGSCPSRVSRPTSMPR